MQAFLKINSVVDNAQDRKDLTQVHVVVNKDKFKSCKFGKYSKPIIITYKYSNREDVSIENPNVMIKIPSTCEDCINTLGTRYSVIIADATNAKRYTSPDGKDHTYYDCSVSVIRNPLAIKKCEDIEASAFNVTEYEF